MKNGSRNLYIRMLGYIKPYIAHLGLSGGLSICTVLFESVSLWFIATLLQTLFQQGQQAPETLEFSLRDLNESLKYLVYRFVEADDPLRSLERVCMVFLIAFALKNVFFYLKKIVVSWINLSVVRDIRNDLFGHTLQLPVSYYDRNKSGTTLSIILNDVNSMNMAMSDTFNKLITEPLRFASMFFLMCIISWKMTVAIFLIYPLLGFVIVKIGQSFRRRSKRVLEKAAGMMAVLHETIGGVRAVKMFNMIMDETEKFKTENQKFVDTTFRSLRIGSLSSPLTEVLGLCIAVVLLWFGGRQVLMGQGMSAEDFIRFLVLLFFSYQPLKALSTVNNAVQGGLAGAERVFTVLDTRPEPIRALYTPHIPVFEKDISYNGVSFTYPGCEEDVLADISFSVPKGAVVALVGSSGSGKTTILDLLPRFYEPSRGTIAIDGVDIMDMDLVGLRHLFGIVAQDTILFNDTVHNNIAYGLKEATRQDVFQAAQAANAWEFIEKLPKQFETEVGERGVTLSGGQCQRLSIARALLKNPPVLILDEATSALDTESERLVQAAINNLVENRTALVVAHRLSTIQHADIIMVLDNGRIVERGTHDELMRPGTRYRYFHDIQFAAPQTG